MPVGNVEVGLRVAGSVRRGGGGVQLRLRVDGSEPREIAAASWAAVARDAEAWAQKQDVGLLSVDQIVVGEEIHVGYSVPPATEVER